MAPDDLSLSGGVPAEPGTQAVPPGHIRLYHYTRAEEGVIDREGLRMDKAIGEVYGEPNMVWASAQKPSPEARYAEFTVAWNDPAIVVGGIDKWRTPSEDDLRDWELRGNNLAFMRTIEPGEFLAVHEPWHSTFLEFVKQQADPEEFAWIDEQADQYPELKRALDEYRIQLSTASREIPPLSADQGRSESSNHVAVATDGFFNWTGKWHERPDEVTDMDARALNISADGKVVGSVLYCVAEYDDEGVPIPGSGTMVESLFVDPEHRRQGLALQLVDAARRDTGDPLYLSRAMTPEGEGLAQRLSAVALPSEVAVAASVDPAELYELAVGVAADFIPAPDEWKYDHNWCGQASDALVAELASRGIEARREDGYYKRLDHSWVRMPDGTIVDPTVSQFKSHRRDIRPYIGQITDSYTAGAGRPDLTPIESAPLAGADRAPKISSRPSLRGGHE